MDRTPVSILQELCEEYYAGSPEYEDISDISPINGEFYSEYQVKAFGLKIKARGRNNREARESAARVLLVHLQEHIKAVGSIWDFLNYVEGLYQFCLRQNLPQPKFSCKFEGDGFIATCQVDQVKLSSKASSDKTAKQLVAKLMWDVLIKKLSREEQEYSGDSEGCFLNIQRDKYEAAKKLLATKSVGDKKAVLDVCKAFNIPWKYVSRDDQWKEVLELSITHSYVSSSDRNAFRNARTYLRKVFDSLPCQDQEDMTAGF